MVSRRTWLTAAPLGALLAWVGLRAKSSKSSERRAAARKAGPPQPVRYGWNVTPTAYYLGSDAYIDLMRIGVCVHGKDVLTSLGYPAARASVHYDLIRENDPDQNTFKPGTYIATWSRNGATVTLQGEGVAAQKSNTGRVAITLPSQPIGSGDEAINFQGKVWLSVLVADGESATLDLKVFHADDEPRLKAGHTYTAQFVARMQTASKGPIRPMQFSGVEHGWVRDPADITPPGKIADHQHGYAQAVLPVRADLAGGRSIRAAAPEDIGRMGFECERDIWLNTPPMMTDACMAEYFRRVAAAYPTGKVYAEPYNEVWNASYVGNSLYLRAQYGDDFGTGLRDAKFLGGTTTDADARLKNAGHLALRTWKAAEGVFGRGRVVRVVSGQNTYWDLSRRIYQYVDPGILQAGKSVGQQMDSVCLGNYYQMTLDVLSSNAATGAKTDTGRGVTQLRRWNGIGLSLRQMVRHKMWTNVPENGHNADAWWENAWKNGIDDMHAYSSLFSDELAAAGFPAASIVYEGGTGDTFKNWGGDDRDASGAPVNPGLFMAYDPATGDLTPTSGRLAVLNITYTDAGEAVSNWFADGDIVRVGPYMQLKAFNTQATCVCRVVAGKLRLYADSASYAKNSPVTGAVAGNAVCVNVTRTEAMWQYMMNLLQNTATGTRLLEHVHQRAVERGVTVYIEYAAVGAQGRPFRSQDGAQPWAFNPHGYWSAPTRETAWVQNKV